jgi:hypothetical protein
VWNRLIAKELSNTLGSKSAKSAPKREVEVRVGETLRRGTGVERERWTEEHLREDPGTGRGGEDGG